MYVCSYDTLILIYLHRRIQGEKRVHFPSQKLWIHNLSLPNDWEHYVNGDALKIKEWTLRYLVWSLPKRNLIPKTFCEIHPCTWTYTYILPSRMFICFKKDYAKIASPIRDHIFTYAVPYSMHALRHSPIIHRRLFPIELNDTKTLSS